MGKKFLIIDDSALMRRVISDIIRQNSDYEVLDLATNGLEGFNILVSKPQYYDLIILDINMPKMNGLEMLEMLQKSHMNETVVVVSTVAKEGAAETMKALEFGAIDFLTKPENFYEVKSDDFKDRLTSLISVVTSKDLNKHNLIHRGSVTGRPVTEVKKPLGERSSSGNQERRNQPAGNVASGNISRAVSNGATGGNKIIALACSTGGPKSLQQVIPYLPSALDAPMVLVQHMPKGFTASLAARLDSLSKITVTEAKDGDILEKGHVYIAPGGMHIRVRYENGKHIIKYDDSPAIEGLKPCANVMYESLIDSKYEHITCVVLTGMGADGTKGITALKKAGKKIYVISQNADSCVVYGMPRAVYEAGLSNEVETLEKIADSITKNVGVH